MVELNIKTDEIITKIKRAFGFGYPHTVIILHDGDDEIYMENPEIQVKKIKAKNGDKHQISINTIARDPKTNNIVQIRGDVRKHIKPQRIIDIYPEGAITLLLPAFIIYTFILLWMFGAVIMDTITIMAITFLIAMMFFQGKYVYTEGNIRAIDVAYKGNISGYKLYVPMVKEYLELKPSQDKIIIEDSIKRLVSYFKPIMAENKLLTEEIQKMADGYSKSFLLGLRMRKGYMELTEKYPAWLWAVIGVIIGIILGIVISGGVAPAPEGMAP